MENKVENNTVNEQGTAPKRKLNNYQILSIVCAALLVAIALGVGIYFIVKNAQENKLKNPTTPAQIEQVLTEENYNKINVGMPYSEVFKILGAGKQQPSEIENTINIVWEANSNRYIIITFTTSKNDKDELVFGNVVEKMQLGVVAEEQTQIAE